MKKNNALGISVWNDDDNVQKDLGIQWELMMFGSDGMIKDCVNKQRNDKLGINIRKITQ